MALAVNILRAHSLALAAPSPRGQAILDRMRNPVVGDLVVETSSSARRGGWPGQGIGVLLEINDAPAYSRKQWRSICRDEKRRFDSLTALDAAERRDDPLGIDAWLLQRGPRLETDPIPTEREYVIEPLLGDDETVRWSNADFVAGFLSPYDGVEPVKLSRAMLRAMA